MRHSISSPPLLSQWIDDSSCNVVFADAHSAKRAIVGRGAPLPPDAAAAAPDCAGLDPGDLANAPYLWHKGDDFVKGGTPIPLVYRMAVATDVKPTGGGKLSRRLWRLPAARALEAVGVRGGGEGVRGGVGKRRGLRRGGKGGGGMVE